MPDYTYQSDDGEQIDVSMPMDMKHPDFIVQGGRKYHRVFNSQVDADVESRVHGYPYVSHSLPRNLSGASHTPEGKPVITSRLHEREVAARHGMVRD